jgi:cytoplasmic iron level regulating protein YaaA (DUF328/UPF0246 family)
MQFAQEHLRVLCGLYGKCTNFAQQKVVAQSLDTKHVGVLKPFDNIRPYRLDMGKKLANPKGKDL